MIDDTLNWDNHIDQLISRLNSVCYTIRAVKAVLSKKALRMLYFSCVHSVISYGIIFWINTPKVLKYSELKKKKKLRIMTNSKKMDSCRKLLITMEILPFYFQYIFSSFIVCGERQTCIYKELRIP